MAGKKQVGCLLVGVFALLFFAIEGAAFTILRRQLALVATPTGLLLH